MLDTAPNARMTAFLGKFDAALAAGDVDAAVAMFARGELLARSRRLHLEHQDDGRARSGPRHADPLPQASEAARLARRRGRDRDRGGRRARILDFVRDRDRARLWPHPHQGRPHLDAADHDGRTQGPRGEGGLHPRARREARRQSRRQDLEGIARRGGREARLRNAALCADHRRRAGRDRARRALEATRRADDHRRKERARGRFLAQALQVALPARSGLVRPSALYRLSEELAGVLAQGQDRRLAGNVRQGDGAELLDQDDGQERELRSEEEGMDGRRRSRRQEGHPAAQATGVCDRHVLQAGHAALQGHGDLQGRAASFVRPSRARRLQGQEGRRHRLEQFSP